VVTQQADISLHNKVNAFAGIWSVSDNISQANYPFDTIIFDVVEDSF
jgi:hypothetical protein